MKKNTRDTIKVILLIIPLEIFTKKIEYFPWWSFVIPVLIFGMVITIRNWHFSSFTAGFLSGFLTWFGANLYFDLTLNGIVLDKIGLLLSVPKIIVLLISGLIGGLLTGLALYSGKAIAFKKPIKFTI